MNDKKKMMEQNIPFELIAKYLSGQCSEAESIELQKWTEARKENKETFEQMEKSWDNIPFNNYEPNIESALNKVSARLPEQKQKRTISRSTWLSIAAVLVVGLGLFGVYNSMSRKIQFIEVANLTNTTKQVILPDGSIIALSKDSELKYPEIFAADIRKIQFSGEAYFDIETNKEKPFVIESGIAITKVLGTEFNLKALKSDSLVKVTVTEGLVSLNINSKEAKKEVLVEVGEVGKLDVVNRQVTKEKNSDLNFMAWKDGKLSFENKALKDALEELSSYYKKDFIAPAELKDELFNGYFDSMNIDEAKSHLEMLLEVSIVAKGDILVLERK